MALEDKIQELIDAVNRNTAVTESLMNLRKEAIEQVKSDAKPDTKKSETKPKAEDKPAPEKTEPQTEERQITDAPEDRKEPEASGPTHEDLAKAIQGYVGLDDDDAGRAERSNNVKKIFGHEKIQAKKHSEVPQGMIATVISNIDRLKTKWAEEHATASADEDLVG